jgi:Protein kinase domain
MHMSSIGRYLIERELGRGAMGIVYLATDPQLHRQVAVKTCSLPDGISQEQAALFHERFLREARAAASLSHPGIVTVYDAGEDPARGIPYIAMEYVPGRTLRQRLEKGERLDPAWVMSFGAVLADALHQAHRAGIVHRDIKPANILIRDGDGAVKLADFGVARLKASDLTQSGVPLGSPGYMSPEQVKGGELDGRSDLFSLAVVLYEALCGKRPFRGDELVSLAYSIAHETHVPLGRQLPSCGPGLDRFFDRALSKDPDKRFPDGAAFKGALLGVEASHVVVSSERTVADASTVGVTADPRTIAMAPPVVPASAARASVAGGKTRGRARAATIAALALIPFGLLLATFLGFVRPAILKARSQAPGSPPAAAVGVASPPATAAMARTPAVPQAHEPSQATPRDGVAPIGVAPTDAGPSSVPPVAPKYVQVTLPAGTEIHLELDTAVGSGSSRAGDNLTARVTDPVVVGSRVVIPAGSRVHGRVAEATPAKKGLADKAGSLRLSFDSVSTPVGFGAAMSATLTSAGSGSGKRTAAAIGGGAAGGALLGRILGRNARGAVIGGALGGAVGTGIAAGSRGDDVNLPAGAPMSVWLDQPLTISVNP